MKQSRVNHNAKNLGTEYNSVNSHQAQPNTLFSKVMSIHRDRVSSQASSFYHAPHSPNSRKFRPHISYVRLDKKDSDVNVSCEAPTNSFIYPESTGKRLVQESVKEPHKHNLKELVT
jgi:hypothetical protein